MVSKGQKGVVRSVLDKPGRVRERVERVRGFECKAPGRTKRKGVRGRWPNWSGFGIHLLLRSNFLTPLRVVNKQLYKATL